MRGDGERRDGSCGLPQSVLWLTVGPARARHDGARPMRLARLAATLAELKLNVDHSPLPLLVPYHSGYGGGKLGTALESRHAPYVASSWPR